MWLLLAKVLAILLFINAMWFLPLACGNVVRDENFKRIRIKGKIKVFFSLFAIDSVSQYGIVLPVFVEEVIGYILSILSFIFFIIVGCILGKIDFCLNIIIWGFTIVFALFILSSLVLGIIDAIRNRKRKPKKDLKQEDSILSLDFYKLLAENVPSYVDINDLLFFRLFVESDYENLTKKEKIAHIKSKIKELYRYDKVPPKWIDKPAWPIDDGKPLVFSHQEKKGKATYYYFYNPNTKKKRTVRQSKK